MLRHNAQPVVGAICDSPDPFRGRYCGACCTADQSEPMCPSEVTACMRNPAKLLFQRALHIRDGRTIRSVADAIALLREHEARPGVDARDVVLHRLERAHNEQEIQQAQKLSSRGRRNWTCLSQRTIEPASGLEQIYSTSPPRGRTPSGGFVYRLTRFHV